MTSQLQLDFTSESPALADAFDAPPLPATDHARRRRLIRGVGFVSADLDVRGQVRAVERLIDGRLGRAILTTPPRAHGKPRTAPKTSSSKGGNPHG